MSMTPFALSLLGAESMARRGNHDDARAQQTERSTTEGRPARTTRRATSYYNSFQTACSTATDDAPSYSVAVRHRPQSCLDNDQDTLPGYSCSISAEAKVFLHLESLNPLHGVSDSGTEWREACIVLRGTLLSLHRVKDNGPGRLLRSYTLQHAEVGLAMDTQHTILVPQTRLAHLIPSGARRKAWQRDSTLFRPVRQHILRLRVETDQLLLACSSEDRIHSLIYAIGAAIDISQAIDERSIPRQCTVPRRRRRQPANPTGDLSDPALLAEQERILNSMYPAFAERATESGTDLRQSTRQSPQTPSREEDDLDLAMIREDAAASPPSPTQSDHRPTSQRQATTPSSNSSYSTDMMYATASANFDSAGKWVPPHTRTQQQIQRYIRRCMPVLLADSVRASDILICNGKRVKINWRMELLEEWELRPPSYKSHGFTSNEPDSDRERSISSSNDVAAVSSAAVMSSDAEDPITPAEAGIVSLELSKVKTIENADQGFPFPAPVSRSPHAPVHSNLDVHGVVFCF